MQRLKFTFIGIVICSLSLFQSSANNESDSLIARLKLSKEDTGKVNLLNKLAKKYSTSETDKAHEYADSALALATRLNFKKGEADALRYLGVIQMNKADFNNAIKNTEEALIKDKIINNKIGIASDLNNIGKIYYLQSNLNKAMEFMLQSIKIREEIHDDRGIASCLTNIGVMFKQSGDSKNAIEHYEKALVIAKKIGDPTIIASCLNNIGIAYYSLKDNEKSLSYFLESVKISEESGNKDLMATNYKNISVMYGQMNKLEESLVFGLKALKTNEEMKDMQGLVETLTNLSVTYIKLHQVDKAIEVLQRSIPIAKKYGFAQDLSTSYINLSEAYSNTGNYKKAYEMCVFAMQLRDSIKELDNANAMAEMLTKYNTEKKEKENKILTQNLEIESLKYIAQAEKLKTSNGIIITSLLALVIAIFLSYFLFKSNKKIHHTNLELTEKKREIQDSINYARNIQNAMLPEVSIIEKHFREGFGVFLPKDVVSGDFYWFNELKNTVYLAVADCTGHGVPGGFMSMIGIDKLNQVMLDGKVVKPSDILSILNVSVKHALKQRDDTSISKDGMDIALCAFDLTNMKLQFSGAHRPLWIIRNNEFLEYKPTKSSIGGHTKLDQVYENHMIDIQNDDCIYLFTDGMVDQFGGPSGKKFKAKKLMELLKEIHSIPMNKQEKILHKALTEWQGQLEQIDDILVMGVRI